MENFQAINLVESVRLLLSSFGDDPVNYAVDGQYPYYSANGIKIAIELQIEGSRECLLLKADTDMDAEAVRVELGPDYELTREGRMLIVGFLDDSRSLLSSRS